ncbi:MAG: glycosyltransferase [Verrucomicrobia bacterium]|nr:glycosyltransferase [Verrucomicrobiota bacterium]
MRRSATDPGRVRVDGKFFRQGKTKFHPKGVTYGPFAPNGRGEPFPDEEQARKDFAKIRELSVNLLRVYDRPAVWIMDLAAQHELKILVDIPWNKHLCFLDSERSRQEARMAVREAARACASHPAVFALSVVNEIPPDIVRWSGAARVAEFIDELVALVKAADPECLCTFGNYPPTEFLRPREIDFHCFNVYIHQQKPFENYLARLQMIAEAQPLILGEFGIDSLREGEDRKCEILTWQIESIYRAGLAGGIVYCFTDDWFKDGRQIEDWAFGVTTRRRQPKPSFSTVQWMFQDAPYFPLRQQPAVSVVVACYNGARTLAGCLDSLEALNYPSYELILVDDGSTDGTAEIASRHPTVRYLRHPMNQGLSAARNTGIEAARGEIVAFTDADCRADRDWLYYVVGDLLNSRCVGIGGHNLLPPDDSWIGAAVMVSPGGPTHVMLTDRLAEHIPGCNMAFYKWALLEVGGFDLLFRKAGDDVDICWRLQQHGYRLAFSPAGFVWHYRRSAVVDYLKQQRGYGESEALLVHRHPEYFNWFGGSQWRGRIYSPAKFGVITRSHIIYHGVFGSGFFQTLYSAPPSVALMLVTSLEYHVLLTLPLFVLSVVIDPFLPLALTSVALSLAVCAVAAAQAELPASKRRVWSRPLVALLFFLQPIVRGWARYRGRLTVPRTRLADYETLDSLNLKEAGQRFDEAAYWNERNLGRTEFLAGIMERLDRRGWPNKQDTGWNLFDIEILGNRWCHLQLLSAAEELAQDKRLIRCRFKTRWTLLAKTTFWSMAGLELLIIGSVGSVAPWVWFLLLSLPAFGWWLDSVQRDLRRLVGVFLDETAKEMGLIKIELGVSGSKKQEAANRTKPVQTATRSRWFWDFLKSSLWRDRRLG